MSTEAVAGKRLCVVGGAGHVGLPLALVFCAAGYHVTILDTNESHLKMIGEGEVPFSEKGAESLLRRALDRRVLDMTSRPDSANIPESSTVIITIGTPVDKYMNPDMAVIRRCADDLLPVMRRNQLLILRSTVYPGTTEWLNTYFQKKGKPVHVAFCPERVVQGCSIEETQVIPQIVGGTSKEATREASELFSDVAPEIVELSPHEAEFAKLFSNAYRYIQFAAANQFYTIAASIGVDYNRVLRGMKRDYPRLKDLPSAGFAAGPCLLKDTMQLAAFSNNQFSLGNAAVQVNEGLVLYLADRIKREFGSENITVGILGMAFKADSDDTRDSLSYKLKKVLTYRVARVLTTDPHVRTDPDLLPIDQVVSESDLLVLAVPHTAYRNLNLVGTPVIDVWGFLVSSV